MRKNAILSIIILTVISGMFTAQLAFAQPSVETGGNSSFSGPLVVECTSGSAIAGTNKKECGWQDLIRQVQKIINFLFYISVILATIAFIWCGVLFLTAGGDVGKAKEAKEILIKVVIGFFWIFAAWLIVHLITSSLGLNPDISILEQQ